MILGWLQKCLILLLFFISLSRVHAQYRLNYDLKDQNWDQIFYDDFDYANTTELWQSIHYRPMPLQPGNTLFGEPEVLRHTSVQNGILYLGASRLSTPVPYNNGVYNFGSAGIVVDQFGYPDVRNLAGDPGADGMADGAQSAGNSCTGNQLGFMYGVFEIRCKLPQETNVFPAFWLWRGGEEIDIFEYGGDGHEVTNNFIDWGGGGNTNSNDYVNNSCQMFFDFERNVRDNFHTWTLAWNPDQLTIFFDGKELRTETRFDVWECPFELYFNMAMSSSATGSNVDTATFEIDYVSIHYMTEDLFADYMYSFDDELVGNYWDIEEGPRSMGIGDNSKVFYRNTSDLLSSYQIVNGSYAYRGIMPTSQPASKRIAGDIVVGENGSANNVRIVQDCSSRKST